MTGNIGRPGLSTSDTVRKSGLSQQPYEIGVSANGNPPYAIIEKDYSLQGAIARQNALAAANPGNTYHVFQSFKTAKGVTVVQVA